MAKDPAFLFYPGDWLGGTQRFSRAQKGAYIDLLMAQFDGGKLPLQDIKDILGSDYDSMWESRLKDKFEVDENGLFFNKRLHEEQEKRKNFSNSRRKNLKKDSHIIDHISSHITNHSDSYMENENRNVNDNKNEEEIKKLKAEFNFNFADEKILPHFFDWLIHKKSKNQKYKNEKSLQACYDNLIELSNNDPETARLIVKQAMGNNWAGLFPLKESFKQQNQSTTQAKQF